MSCRVAVALSCAAALACGGGGDEAPAPQPPAPGPTSAPVPSRVTYVALGDSAGFGVGALPGDGGYPPRLARLVRGAGVDVELVNLSIPGATAREVADLEVPTALGLRPGLVTVCVGANDVGRSREEFAADLESILSRLARLGAPVVLCNVPDLTLLPAKRDEPPSFAAGIAALNAEIVAAAARHGVPVVDLFAASRDRLLARPELVSPDGFHPSAAGYEEWAALMFPTVKAALGLP